MDGGNGAERFETVIIGGGQAGLTMGYHLARRDRPFVILDANPRIGDAWRKRWDSLRLFTAAGHDGLQGMPFPARRYSFPTKDEMADYLEAYAARFGLPVRTGVRVDGLSREGSRYVLTAGDRRLEADRVVVATGACQTPRVPAFAQQLDPGIVQLHSSQYRAPSQLQEGGVLVVGAGNSGAEVALEACRDHQTWLSGRHPGHIPVRHGELSARFVFPVVRFLGHRVLTLDTPIGRKARPKILSRGEPLIRIKPKDIAAAGIQRVPRVVGVRDGLPLLEDQRILEAANVAWCTGFRLDFSWIDLPVFGEDGEPMHQRGVVVNEPGLYFVGLHFLYAFSSERITGVARDAEHIAKHIASHEPTSRPAAQVLAGARQRTPLPAGRPSGPGPEPP
jgi:putative flavoprotein involved in K+ transport